MCNQFFCCALVLAHFYLTLRTTPRGLNQRHDCLWVSVATQKYVGEQITWIHEKAGHEYKPSDCLMAGLILGSHPANERRRYFLTPRMAYFVNGSISPWMALVGKLSPCNLSLAIDQYPSNICDYIITWTYCPYHWSLVKVPLTRGLDVSFLLIRMSYLIKHSSCGWFEMLWGSCNVSVMICLTRR